MVDGRGLGRRRLLRIVTAGAMAGAAGCSGRGSDPIENGDGPRTYTLTVALEEASGDPAPEASVSVQSAQLVPQADAKVPGSDGIVTFDLENGEYVIVVESQEFSNVEEPVTIDGEDVEVTITLRRGFG
ncbi:hypothetical protein [Halalkalicoccus sp. NIPERK01]|uniref:hypothetical protein n=1 Tax=Halalkalicoccus sp. NIPERK01 TaxID=3053469 RepID=UPI00256F30C6|nr:hypothetical protein [Halalkalicoccus sp. NIPERK01]MDL5361050.1 hypothetical protein [Halalkalicoccus sp. NIPERK01]